MHLGYCVVASARREESVAASKVRHLLVVPEAVAALVLAAAHSASSAALGLTIRRQAEDQQALDLEVVDLAPGRVVSPVVMDLIVMTLPFAPTSLTACQVDEMLRADLQGDNHWKVVSNMNFDQAHDDGPCCEHRPSTVEEAARLHTAAVEAASGTRVGQVHDGAPYSEHRP